MEAIAHWNSLVSFGHPWRSDDSDATSLVAPCDSRIRWECSGEEVASLGKKLSGEEERIDESEGNSVGNDQNKTLLTV